MLSEKLQTMRANFGNTFVDGSRFEMRNIGLLVAAVVCAVMPLQISHLLSALVGVLAYLLLQGLEPGAERQPATARASKAQPRREGPKRLPPGLPPPRRTETVPVQSGPAARPSRRCLPQAVEVPRLEVRKPSAMPVAAPTFQGIGWDAEVSELLTRISLTPEGDAAVARIAQAVRRVIWPVLPEAEVAGFASGNPTSGTAFGVAVPEVDIVINVSPQALVGSLQGRWLQGRFSAAKLDAQKLQKSAIRACTDRLVGTGAFKFRRSAFRGQEPKVTIIAPAGIGGSEHGIPVNLSVNALSPLYNAALLTECGQMQPVAKELILLVKRWAKDRGLCHASKGHLSPYTWTLLVIFYFQVGASEGDPLLPALEEFPSSSGLMNKVRVTPHVSNPFQPKSLVPPVKAATESAGYYLKDFLSFYASRFDWRKEAVSIRRGKRGAPGVSLPLHIIVGDDGSSTEVGPSIEDPFEPSHNLGACMTSASLAHLHQEFKRARDLCGASLTALLEPWVPAEVTGAEMDADQDQDD